MDIKQAPIVIKPLAELKLWDKNPREISEEDYERLKKQIQKLGVYKPLLVNQDNIILGGNMRTRAFRDFGMTEVACSIVHTESEAEMIEYALSDNDRAGKYDDERLVELVHNVPIDMDLYRVDMAKTWKIKDVVSAYTEEGEIPEPEADPERVYSTIGEVYQLGDHRLMCGSANDFNDIEKLMDGKRARLIFTDPPYMVNYKSPSGNSYDKGKFEHKGKIFNDALSREEAKKFYQEVAQSIYPITTDDACLYWWFASANQHINRDALINAGWLVSQIIIWVKDGMVMSRGQMYHRAYEPCIVGWKKGKKNYQNRSVVNLKDVWNLSKNDYAELADVWYEHRDNTNEYVHPTQKPIGLAVRALKRSSQIGDIILDVFGGSGSTLIACEQNNRVCYTMELDPVYCDVIRRRYAILLNHKDDWQEFTKQK